MKHILGDGIKIRFWQEVLLGECPLRIKYGKLVKGSGKWADKFDIQKKF
jgi:hypothetical protein